MVTIESTPQELGMLKRERSERFYFLVLNKMQSAANLSSFLIVDCSGVEHIPVMGTLLTCGLRKK